MDYRTTSSLPKFTTSLRNKSGSVAKILLEPNSTSIDLECIRRKKARRKEKGRTVAELVRQVSIDSTSQEKQKVMTLLVSFN